MVSSSACGRPAALRPARWAIAGVVLLAAACSIRTELGPGATAHLGLTYVDAPDPAASAGVSTTRVRTLGARLGPDFSLGYFDEQRILVPLDCHLVVLVRDTDTAAAASSLIAPLQKEGTCIVHGS